VTRAPHCLGNSCRLLAVFITDSPSKASRTALAGRTAGALSHHRPRSHDVSRATDRRAGYVVIDVGTRGLLPQHARRPDTHWADCRRRRRRGETDGCRPVRRERAPTRTTDHEMSVRCSSLRDQPASQLSAPEVGRPDDVICRQLPVLAAAPVAGRRRFGEQTTATIDA